MVRSLRALVFCAGVVSIVSSPAAAAHRESGRVFMSGDVALYMEVLGASPGVPLVVINGGPGSDHLHQHITQPGTTSVWDTLAKKRRVVFYDQRGTGRSPLKPGQTCTVADQLADLEAIRAQLGVEQIDVLGHSWGGFVAMAYGSRHPHRIRRLVLMDSAAPKLDETVLLFEHVFPEGTERVNAWSAEQAKGDPAARSKILREYLGWLFYSPERRDAYLAQLPSSPENTLINQSLLEEASRLDLSPEIRQFSFPTLVIAGRHDFNVAPAVAYKIHKAIPGSTFVVFERSGHLPSYEEPAAFVRTLESFLAR